MSDISLFGIPLDAVKEVGLATAAIFGLVFSLRWLALRHINASDKRVALLEGLFKEMRAEIAARDRRIEQLHKDQLAQTISYAHDMKAIALQLLADNKETRQFMREISGALRARPCLLDQYEPGSLVPKVPETGKEHRHGG